MALFTVEERHRAHDRVLDLAVADQRVVAGAVVGSLALDDGDRWSDLDLTFAVADERQLPDVLADWTRTIVAELDAVQLFDVSTGAAVYRVFVLPGCLQLDLSFAPAASFGALGPKFRLLRLGGREALTPYTAGASTTCRPTSERLRRRPHPLARPGRAAPRPRHRDRRFVMRERGRRGAPGVSGEGRAAAA